MPVELTLDNGKRQQFVAPTITVGCANDCDFVVPAIDGIHDTHGLLRRVANRWMIESCGDWSLHVGQTAPDTRHWIESGSQIDLTPRGPTLHFCIVPEFQQAAQQRRVIEQPLQKSTQHAVQHEVPHTTLPREPAAARTIPVRPSQRYSEPTPAAAEISTPADQPAVPQRRSTGTARRRRREAGILRIAMEITKVVLGAMVGIVCSYYLMCHFLPESMLLKSIAAELPASLQPEVIRGEKTE